VVGLIGPNGAGKTTLMRAALGLLPATGENSLRSLSPADRAKRVAWLPQAREIAWPVAVETLVMLGRVPHLSGGQRPGPEDEAAVAEALARDGPCRVRRPCRDGAFGRRTGPRPDRPRAGAGHAPDPRR
jgi:iron complex transport system ATP-binding protein